MGEAILYSITAIVVAIIIAGGINRAAFYVSQIVVAYIDEMRRKDRIQINGERHDQVRGSTKED